MFYIAHRGYSHKYPDNSAQAFVKALEYNVHMIETDLRVNADHEWVIQHDPTASWGPSSISKWITDLSASQCQLLNMMTLSQFLDLMQKHVTLKLYLDIKGHPQPQDLKNLIEILRDHPLTQYGLNVYLASFNFHVVQDLIELRVLTMFDTYQYKVGKIGGLYPPYDTAINYIDFISTNLDEVDAHYVKRIKTFREGLSIFVYTVNDPLILDYYLNEVPVDGILSDDVTLFPPVSPLMTPPPSPPPMN